MPCAPRELECDAMRRTKTTHGGWGEVQEAGALTAREKYCSTLASCGMCDETCLKTTKWRGKRSRNSQNILKWLSMPSKRDERLQLFRCEVREALDLHLDGIELVGGCVPRVEEECKGGERE